MERNFTPEQVTECSRDLCLQADHCATNCYACNCEKTWLAMKLLQAGWIKQHTGAWQEASDGTHWCSECGRDATYTPDGAEVCGPICPFCGACMKKEYLWKDTTRLQK